MRSSGTVSPRCAVRASLARKRTADTIFFRASSVVAGTAKPADVSSRAWAPDSLCTTAPLKEHCERTAGRGLDVQHHRRRNGERRLGMLSRLGCLWDPRRHHDGHRSSSSPERPLARDGDGPEGVGQVANVWVAHRASFHDAVSHASVPDPSAENLTVVHRLISLVVGAAASAAPRMA